MNLSIFDYELVRQISVKFWIKTNYKSLTIAIHAKL